MLSFLATVALSAYYLPHEEKSFLSWMRSTNQFFTGDDYQTRFGIYMANSRLVQEHNSGKSFKLAMNKFAAYTPAEYKSLLGFRQEYTASRATVSNFKVTDAEVDWREKKVVQPIQDQASCGSCWAFSTAQGCESIYAINTGKLLKFSEQNIVDCVTSCYGCNGGLMTSAINYIVKKQGGKFMDGADYPYTAVAGTCKFDASKAIGQVSGYIEISRGSESDLAAKISQYGPACIAIDASHYSFQLYSSGIYDESSCSSYSLDHGVGCVGYGSENGTAYWIVRNSWGTSWGEQGYIRMRKDHNNQCGVATMSLVAKY